MIIKIEEFDIFDQGGILNVALVTPPREIEERSFSRRSSSIPPFGLMSIYSNIMDQAVNIRIFDANIYSSFDLFMQDLKSFLSKGGIIGVQTFTRTFDIVKFILSHFCSSNVLKVLGGHYISAQERLSHAHIAIRGAGEEPFNYLIKTLRHHIKDDYAYELSKHSGFLFHTRNGGLINTGSHIVNKDATKDIDYFNCGINYSLYNTSAAYEYPNAKLPFYMLSTIGCSGKCTFCSSKTINKSTKLLDIEHILDTLKLAISHGHDYVQFWDDNLLQHSSKNLNAILQLLYDNDIPYSCLARADFLSEKKINILKRTKCYRVFIGVESGNEEILKTTYRKGESIARIISSAQHMRNAGIKFLCGFIIGAPNESIKTIQETLELAKSLNPFALWFEPLCIDKGTLLYDMCAELNRIPTELPNLEYYGSDEPKGMPAVSRIFIDSADSSSKGVKFEKNEINRIITDLNKSFYENKKHHESYFSDSNQSEREYLKALYEKYNIVF